jgi:hypothetical protein
MSDTAEAFWVVAPGRGEIRPAALEAPTDTDVVVRALHSGISRGTEATVFLGRVPTSERDRMRAPFQEGDFPGPVKYGYTSVGIVEHGPPALADRQVFVLYPHQTRYVVPASAVHVLPDDVPPARAVLAANLETAINGIWDAEPKPGDRVTVVGAGVVGCLVAWLAARTAGCRVELVDIDPARSTVAASLGIPFALSGAASEEADVVIHASGAPEGLARALELANFEATIVEMSWFGDRMVPLALGGAFHSKRLTLRSSQVGHVAPSQRGRWDTRRRMQLALTLLSDPALDVLISGDSAFHDLPDVMARITRDAAGILCQRINYPEP